VSEGGCRARIATLSRLITEASNRAGVDPFLTAAIALRESGLNPLAVSPVGARGVVQLNPKYRGKTVGRSAGVEATSRRGWRGTTPGAVTNRTDTPRPSSGSAADSSGSRNRPTLASRLFSSINRPISEKR
jgi:hypothetical protein